MKISHGFFTPPEQSPRPPSIAGIHQVTCAEGKAFRGKVHGLHSQKGELKK